jgi:carbonic anhydrase
MVIPTIDKIFDVLQFHIHSGSDHSLDDEYFGADLHIVHKNRNGSDLSVLGLFLEPTNTNKASNFFDIFIAGIESAAEETNVACVANSNTTSTGRSNDATRRHLRILQDVYNPYQVVPANSTMYSYPGSLTTPPCSEIVTWNVVDTPVSISVSEYNSIIELIFNYVDPTTCLPASVFSPSGYTSRPVQPLNGRKITHFCPTDTESRFEVPVSAPSPAVSAASTGTSTPISIVSLLLTVVGAALY